MVRLGRYAYFLRANAYKSRYSLEYAYYELVDYA